MNVVVQMLNDRIIEQLNNGVIPWKKPWVSVNDGAWNYFSEHRYSLTNQLTLKHRGPYATYDQWKKVGNVKQGEKAEVVFFWKWPEVEPKEDDNKDSKKKQKPVLRYYRVFHISQVVFNDGVPKKDPKVKLFQSDSNDAVEKIIGAYIAREGITWDGGLYNEAYYMPRKDLIHIPSMEQYKLYEEYYSTAFHEMAHSTGISSRLNRRGFERASYGSMDYGREELVAEIASAMLCNMLNIQSEHSIDNSAAYLGGWLKAIQEDSNMILYAAKQADKAAEFILKN